jgi:hypothetical protein
VVFLRVLSFQFHIFIIRFSGIISSQPPNIRNYSGRKITPSQRCDTIRGEGKMARAEEQQASKKSA